MQSEAHRVHEKALRLLNEASRIKDQAENLAAEEKPPISLYALFPFTLKRLVTSLFIWRHCRSGFNKVHKAWKPLTGKLVLQKIRPFRRAYDSKLREFGKFMNLIDPPPVLLHAQICDEALYLISSSHGLLERC